MNEELMRLEEELDKVMRSELEYLPEYGYSSKEEILQLIHEDIEEVKAELECSMTDYSEEEMEDERMRLCILQGIPRYC